MTDLEKIELAVRRAAAQMPNFQSRGFRLFADELFRLSIDTQTDTGFALDLALKSWRETQEFTNENS